MSNILSDVHRQEIASIIIGEIQPNAYVDVGVYEGSSMDWWQQQMPNAEMFGCDLNETALKICKLRIERAQLSLADSREWLTHEDVRFPKPTVFYLDTDWTEDVAKREELNAIFDLFGDFVIIANSINRPDHPLCGNAFKPWTVDMIAEYKPRCSQIIVPTYKKEDGLDNGYAVLVHPNFTIPFDPRWFEQL